MNATETVAAVLRAIEASKWDEARSYLTDDFTFEGAVPQPIGADAWLGMHRALNAAMPDFSFNGSDFREDQGKVSGHLQLTGTQTRELAVPVPGIPAIPPTGKRVSLPTESATATMRGDKIASYHVEPVAGGGLLGLLAQLGATIPA